MPIARLPTPLAPSAKRAASPLDRLINATSFRCTVCKEPAGTCDCWRECSCGRTHLKDEACPRADAAQQAADFIAGRVIAEMRRVYPEAMRHASGGFAKTLKGNIVTEAKAMVLEILNTDPGKL